MEACKLRPDTRAIRHNVRTLPPNPFFSALFRRITNFDARWSGVQEVLCDVAGILVRFAGHLKQVQCKTLSALKSVTLKARVDVIGTSKLLRSSQHLLRFQLRSGKVSCVYNRGTVTDPRGPTVVVQNRPCFGGVRRREPDAYYHRWQYFDNYFTIRAAGFPLRPVTVTGRQDPSGRPKR
jgi:hypothetical protein